MYKKSFSSKQKCTSETATAGSVGNCDLVTKTLRKGNILYINIHTKNHRIKQNSNILMK